MATKRNKGLGRGLEALLGPRLQEGAAGDMALDTPFDMERGERSPSTLLLDQIPGQTDSIGHDVDG